MQQNWGKLSQRFWTLEKQKQEILEDMQQLSSLQQQLSTVYNKDIWKLFSKSWVILYNYKIQQGITQVICDERVVIIMRYEVSVMTDKWNNDVMVILRCCLSFLSEYINIHMLMNRYCQAWFICSNFTLINYYIIISLTRTVPYEGQCSNYNKISLLFQNMCLLIRSGTKIRQCRNSSRLKEWQGKDHL